MLLEAKNISKSFHDKKVLHNINLSLEKGEICGLVGKNGAGKSTFSNIICGLLKEDAGELYFEGEKIGGESVVQRQKRGIFIVPQHSSVVMDFTVTENLFIGKWIIKKHMTDEKAMNKLARVVLEQYGMNVDPSIKAKNLSLVEQRKLNIVRALFSDAKLVILDEPTTSLKKEDRTNLFHFVKKLSEKGVSFIFISHYLDEIIELSDKIVVFRDGYAKCISLDKKVNELELSEEIVGQGVELYQRKPQFGIQQPILRCENLKATGVYGSSFELGTGNVIGFVSFPGEGARETMRALGGLSDISTGKIIGADEKIIRIKKPRDARNYGIMYVPFDRHDEGLVQEMSILNNISLCKMDEPMISSPLGVIHKKKEISNAYKYYEKLEIKANSPKEKVRMLSGGNQQKVLLAKVLCCNPSILLLDEPTIGIDIGSREEILELVDKLAQQGVTVVYHTSDYSELLRICDKIYFFHKGKFIKAIENNNLSIAKITEIRDSLKDFVEKRCLNE